VIWAIDTSVLVRLVVGRPADLADVARGFVEQAWHAAEPVRVTDVVLAEAWYALKLHYACEPAEVRAALRTMLSSGMVSLEPGSRAIEALVEADGATGFVDRLIRARHADLGAHTVTFDRHMRELDDVLLLPTEP